MTIAAEPKPDQTTPKAVMSWESMANPIDMKYPASMTKIPAVASSIPSENECRL